MSKPALLIAAAILTVLGAGAATKSLVPVTSATEMHDSLAPTHVASRVSSSGMMAIVPAPVIDSTAEVFVGTGDGSGGAWVKP